jgi:hypothetical protein
MMYKSIASERCNAGTVKQESLNKVRVVTIVSASVRFRRYPTPRGGEIWLALGLMDGPKSTRMGV